MKNYLEHDEINLQICPALIEETYAMVKGIYRADRGQPYQIFYCTSVIKTRLMGPQKSPFTLLVNNQDNKLIWDLRPGNYHQLPKKLFPSKRDKKNYQYIHVLVEKRIYYYSHSYEESRIVTKPDQKALGYYSNSSVIDEEGLAVLKDIYRNKKVFSVKRKMFLHIHYILIKSSELFANLFHYQVSKKAA